MTDEQISALDPKDLKPLPRSQLKVGYVVPLQITGGGTRAVIVEVNSYGVRFDRNWGSIKTSDMFPAHGPLYCWPIEHAVGTHHGGVAGSSASRAITNYPHHCTRCGRPAYVGLNETDHADESIAADCPAPRGRRAS